MEDITTALNEFTVSIDNMWILVAAILVMFMQPGFALVEAMACGCPVVSTACPGSVEILAGSRYGQIVPIGDVDALGEAIITSLDSPPHEEALKRRSLDFSAECSVEQYEGVLAGQHRVR